MEELSIEVEGSHITVSMPGTDLWVTYQKEARSPQLVITGSSIGLHITSPPVSEFRARAFQAAVSKARELGWIV